MTHLQELHDRVEAGEFFELNESEVNHYFGSVFEQDHWAWQAYNSSIDAAKALHEAVLPGWKWSVGSWGAAVWYPGLAPENGPRIELSEMSKYFPESRALLLCDLRVLIAQSEEKTK